MARMVRKQIYIQPEQDERLKRLSGRLGVSESDLIRKGVALVLSETPEEEDIEGWLAARSGEDAYQPLFQAAEQRW